MENENSKFRKINIKKIINLSHPGPRASPIINQGALFYNHEILIDKPYVSLGKTIIEASSITDKHLNDSDIIFYGKIGINQDLLWETKLKKYWHKVIIYDFEDSPNYNEYLVKKALLYFKRSVTKGPDRKFINFKVNNKEIYPIDYCALKEYYLYDDLYYSNKIYDVTCLFNKTGIGNRRQNLIDCLTRKKHYFINPFIGITCDSKQYGSHARNAIAYNDNCFSRYINILRQSTIIFTAFPQNHDGDSRTWEALASGALVFRDKTYIESHPPLINNQHFIEYDASNVSSIMEAIDKAIYYLNHINELNVIARAGYEFVKENHMAQHRFNYMLNKTTCQLKHPFSI